MWTWLALAYAVGMVVTWVDLQSRVFTRDRLLAGGLTLFWPAYWGCCLYAILVKRKSP